MSGPRSAFRQFIGISLAGGRGKHTAVARLRYDAHDPAPNLTLHHAAVRMGHRGTGERGQIREGGGGYMRDEELEAYLDEHLSDDTLVAVDVPLTLPACLACDLACPGIAACPVPRTRLLRDLARRTSAKPAVLPYVDRACELLRRQEGLPLLRGGFGQGAGALVARAQYLRRRFTGRLRHQENLVEVSPRGALVRWFGAETDRRTRVGSLSDVRAARAEVLEALRGHLRFERVWPEVVVRKRAVFYAVLVAVVAHMLCREGWRFEDTVEDPERADWVARNAHHWLEDGWVWVPPGPLSPTPPGPAPVSHA